MNMSVSYASQEDKLLIAEFFKARCSAELDTRWFANNTTVAVKDDGRVLALIVCYIEAAGEIGQIGWIVTDPDNTPQQSKEALDTGVEFALDFFRKMGVTFVLSYLGVPSLNRILSQHGFVPGDSDTIQMVRAV